MLTSPVAAARAAVATGAWVKSKHDMYLIRGSVGAEALFLPIRRRIKKQNKTKQNNNMLRVYVRLLYVQGFFSFEMRYVGFLGRAFGCWLLL